MENVIEFKKHSQQNNDFVASAIYRNNRPLKRVHDFGCPVPLYSDAEGRLYTHFMIRSKEERPLYRSLMMLKV